MRRIPPTVFLIGFWVFGTTVVRPQSSAQREKVAEGEYTAWEDGHPLKDTSQIWTIWQTPDGYELEDALPPDKSAALWAVTGAALWKNMSPDLREEYKNASTTTDIHLQLSRDGSFRGLTLNGKMLSEVKQVQVANCLVKENQISCKGRAGTAHLKNSGQDQLLYSYPCPLFFIPMLKQSKLAPGQEIPLKLAVLEEVKNKLQLTEVSGQLRSEGPNKLSIGEYTFDSQKYALALDAKSGPRQVILWASAKGIVFAMEDSKSASGYRVMLSQYKRYLDF